jgi:2-oxo-4-hydroxy-4-carboxy-5-ureidoimidazoline decarboxylase
VPSAHGVALFNQLPAEPVLLRLLACLNAPGWATAVLAGRPYPDAESLLATAFRFGLVLSEDDLALALSKHPRIGERLADASREAAHSRSEQSGVDPADADLAAQLQAGNLAYEEKFDRVFLIRAAGRSGPEILAALTERLTNDPVAEADVVRDQLAQIAQLRLGALLDELPAALEAS